MRRGKIPTRKTPFPKVPWTIVRNGKKYIKIITVRTKATANGVVNTLKDRKGKEYPAWRISYRILKSKTGLKTMAYTIYEYAEPIGGI